MRRSIIVKAPLVLLSAGTFVLTAGAGTAVAEATTSTCAQVADANSLRGDAALVRRTLPGNTGGLASSGSLVAPVTGDVAQACSI